MRNPLFGQNYRHEPGVTLFPQTEEALGRRWGGHNAGGSAPAAAATLDIGEEYLSSPSASGRVINCKGTFTNHQRPRKHCPM